MKKIFFTSFILLFACNMFAQTRNVDSLVNVLENNKLSIEENFSIYNDICYYYLGSDNQKVMLYAREALSLAEKENNNKWICCFNTVIGKVYEREEDYDKAFDYYDKALNIAIREKMDTFIAYVYGSMASWYHRQGKLVTAIDFLLKALSLYEKGETIDHKRQQMVMMTNIGTLHRGLENPERAIYFLQKAENIADEIDYSEGKIQIYYDMGVIFRENKEYEKALDYALKSLELSRFFGDKRFESANLQSLAFIYNTGFNDLAKAEECVNECLRIAKELNEPYLLTGAWHTLAKIYFYQERYAESEMADLTAWEIDSINTDLAFYITFNIGMTNMYLGNKEKAAYYLDKSIDIIRQATNKDFQNLLIDLEVKYETEKKEMRIASLEEERKFYFIMGISGVVVLLLAFGLLFFRHRLNVQKRKMAEQQIKQFEQERQLIATQAVLDGEAAERSRLARDLHDGLGGMLSVVKLNLKEMKQFGIMDGSDIECFSKALEMLDQSIGELRRVAHHIMPESLMRYGLKVSLEDFCHAVPGAHFQYLGENPRLDSRLEVLIYRCAYELVNNAVKHAQATTINVQLIIDNGVVSLTVHDNGIGFDPQTVNYGIGLENIRNRIAVYNGKMTIHSSPDAGTEISIEIEPS